MLRKILLNILMISIYVEANEIKSDKPWEIGATATYNWEGQRKDTLDSSLAAGLRIAYHISNSWTATLKYQFADNVGSSSANRSSASIKQYLMGVNYSLLKNKNQETYIIGALGYKEYSPDIRHQNGDANINVGLGYSYMIQDNISIFTEAVYQKILNHDDTSANFTIGASLHF